MKLPLFATEYYAYNSVPSIESIKLLTIIEAKMGQNGIKSKSAIFIKLSVLSGLKRFNVDFSLSYQYFLKRVSALKFPLTATEYYA